MTILKIKGGAAERAAATRALQAAGIQFEISEAGGCGAGGEAMRSLSHDLRTPLSSMAGWIHLIETGKLDEAALKRAITKLRGNIDDQVRILDRYLGVVHEER